jgi:flagellar motility protein MotE (MotC chaperone)
MTAATGHLRGRAPGIAVAAALLVLGASAGELQARDVSVPALTGAAVDTVHPTVKLEPGRASAARLVVAESESKPAKEKEDPSDSLPLPPTTPVELTPAEQYCSNVVDAAAAAQVARQTIQLQKAQKQLDERIALLADKTEVLKSWIKKREDFTAHATDSLIQIYTKMKPDAAASQLAAMDEATAAAIVYRLSPKANSLILAEMDSAKAARLSAVIAGAGDIPMKPEPKANEQQQ